jgi:hypothetical protein
MSALPAYVPPQLSQPVEKAPAGPDGCMKSNWTAYAWRRASTTAARSFSPGPASTGREITEAHKGARKFEGAVRLHRLRDRRDRRAALLRPPGRSRRRAWARFVYCAFDLLHLDGPDAATHVGVWPAGSHPHPARHRDHRSLRTLRTRRSASGFTALSTRTRLPEPNLISIIPDFARRLLAAARDCLASSDPESVAAPISTASKIEPSLPPGSGVRACLLHVKSRLCATPCRRGHLAHHGAGHQSLRRSEPFHPCSNAVGARPRDLAHPSRRDLRIALKRSHPSRQHAREQGGAAGWLHPSVPWRVKVGYDRGHIFRPDLCRACRHAAARLSRA